MPLVNKLGTTDDMIKESDIIFYTFIGLPHEYNGFKSAIKTRRFPIDFDELSTLLKAWEINISMDNTHTLSHESIPPTAQYH